jgi:hypothetical protein
MMLGNREQVITFFGAILMNQLNQFRNATAILATLICNPSRHANRPALRHSAFSTVFAVAVTAWQSARCRRLERSALARNRGANRNWGKRWCFEPIVRLPSPKSANHWKNGKRNVRFGFRRTPVRGGTLTNCRRARWGVQVTNRSEPN